LSAVAEWRYSPDRAITSSIRCLKDSLSLAAFFLARVPSNATASSLTPSSQSYPGFSYSSLAVDCLLWGFLWCTMFILNTWLAHCSIMILHSMYPSLCLLVFAIAVVCVLFVYLRVVVRFRNSTFFTEGG
jgi:hypothetical protein